VIIENRAGGNALIGADAAAKSPADGYTLLAITMTHTVNASLFPNAPFNFRQDFAAISVLGSLPLVVVVNAERNPARSLADLLTQARERNLNAGSSGNGSPPHLGLELVRRVSGAGDRITHVPYRGGAPSVTDLAAGNLDFMVSNLPECIAQIQGGRLRPLAITSAARHPLVPDVPTVREAGSPELEMTNWTAMLTNAAVPAPILAKLNAAMQSVLKEPELVAAMAARRLVLEASTPEELAAFLRQETARWAPVVRASGARPD
jgi:tripartite-type tricarboxylate transporter receptor subunit TctC